METLQTISNNILGGVGFALLAVVLDTRLTITGVRDYIVIVTIAILGAASVIERWFLDSSFITSCLLGFSIGILADDVYINLKTAMPDFIKEIVSDVSTSIKNKVRKFLGL